jgi:hypothetical protein
VETKSVGRASSLSIWRMDNQVRAATDSADGDGCPTVCAVATERDPPVLIHRQILRFTAHLLETRLRLVFGQAASG